MQTQIQCPQCGTPFMAEVHQLVDAERSPQLKEMLLAGALNVAQCPQCGNTSRLASPIMYHDASHEMLIVHVPMELGWSMTEQERQIGQMAKAITDSLPPEQFKAYLLQPKVIMTMPTFMEQVYGTEGITPEMINRQKDQGQLLQDLAAADKLAQIAKIQEKADLIDETFFAMLQSNLQMLEQNPAPEANKQFIMLTNLQARLLTSTEIGKKIEAEQLAVGKFQQAVQKQGGLTYEIFLEHLTANHNNEPVQNSIMRMGHQAIRYELFTMLTDRIENSSGTEAEELTQLRERLLVVYEQMEAQAQEAMAAAGETLQTLLASPDPVQAVQQNLNQIDEPFMQFLAAQLQAAEKEQDTARIEQLQPLYTAIMAEAENQMPPEVRLINALVATDDENQMQQVINQIPAEARPEIKQMIGSVIERAAAENPELAQRLEKALTLM
ncbi:MAG: CpXC domain-containing protein [Anaerolineae bacterium]